LVGNIEIDFQEIRPYDGDKRKGFEEFVCRLARREKKENAQEFRRVEGSGGDAGVEGYWILKDGTKHGYQAKYFLATKDIHWSQIDKSVKTALEKHPDLTQYTIAVACDLTDRSGNVGRGKTGWGQWESHKATWEQWAKAKGITVEFIPWTKSEIVDKLVSDTANHGLALYWFNANLFDPDWFENLFKRVKADLDDRFQPEDHVEIQLSKVFDGLARSPDYLNFLSNWFRTVPNTDDVTEAIIKLAPALDKKFIQDLGARCVELRMIGEIIYTFEARPFPLADWQNTINAVSSAILPIREWLDSQDENANTDIGRSIRNALNCLRRVAEYLYTSPIHFGANHPQGIIAETDARRLLIVVGEAGIGKSHIFADAVASSLNRGVPAILLLGQYFHEKDIRQQFLELLGLANHDSDKVLQALNAAGESSRTRLIILIDALNETDPLRIWNDQLAGFVSDILKYEWLAIGISLRPEYEEILIPEIVRKNAARVECRGIQSPAEQEQAAVQYFEKRGITRPAVPWLAPEFSNFLFLKTSCDALQEQGIKEFPRGLRGALLILKFYLDSLDLKIRRRFPNIVIPRSAIQESIQGIARLMITEKTDYITLKAATDICESQFGRRGPDSRKNWFSVLAEEGVFRLDHIFSDDKNDPFANVKDVYRFTYQRFSHHLIVQELLEQVDNINNAFQTGGSLSFLLGKDEFWAWGSLWAAIAVQIPEKFSGTELLDVLPEEIYKNYSQTFVEAFQESLLWRSDSAFSDRTLEMFNALPIVWHDHRLNILIRLATLRDHPWNAEFLNHNLQRRPMPERDAFWTVQINATTYDDQYPIWELIQWCLNANLKLVDIETLRLAALTLAWIFTSSSSLLRDKATKALISIFVNCPQLIPFILERFQDVDDLYVMERICAAILGVVTRDRCRDNVKTIAQAVNRAVFARETPHFNINLRDYARAVIEYALLRGNIDDEIDITKCRRPYRSQWPLADITKEELEKIAEESGGKQILYSALSWGDFARYEVEPKVHHFTCIPLDQPHPLNQEEREEVFLKELASWDISKQEAFAQLKSAIKEKESSLQIQTGNKENYHITFFYPKENIQRVEECETKFINILNKSEKKYYSQIMMPVLFPERTQQGYLDIPKFDVDFAKRWITERAYGYGWNNKLFPNDEGSREISHERAKIERIGKKYQWLALSEFLARLSDNVWSIGRWPERAMTYDHPATDWFVRDVEPSILRDPVQRQDEKHWWQALPLKMDPIDDDGLRSWPFKGEPPNRSNWMDVVAPDGTPWLLLYGFFIEREYAAKEEVRSIAFRRDIFVRVTTILVDAESVGTTISKLKGCRLADPSGHETQDWTDGPFLCEYPWRNTWQADYIWEDSGMRNFSGLRYIRPVARHAWESQLDLSLKNGSSIYIPSPWLGEKLGLKVNLGRLGEFVSEYGGQVIFMDPSVGIYGPSAALIDKARFFNFLENERLECLWIVAGERSSWPSGRHGDYSRRSFAGVYQWTGEKWIGNRWYADTQGSPSS
jgi:hypothetical protein